MSVEVLRYAAFTDSGSGGNPAGVVFDAAGLSDRQMLAIAQDVGFSETAFAELCASSADLIERQGMPASVEDLGRFRLCSLTPALPHFTASNWWKGRDHGAVVSFVANTETALAAAIAGGAGIGVLPRFIGDRLDAVRRIPAIDIGDPVDIWLITHPTLSENAVVRSLIRALAAAIRKDARLFAGSNR